MPKLFTILTVVVCACSVGVTAGAADWGFYGQSRLSAFETTVDGGDPFTAPASGGNGTYLDGVFQRKNRVNPDGYGNNRSLWAEYDFGGLRLGLGRHYTPVNAWVGSQAYRSDAGLLDVGGIYGGRNDMVQLTLLDGTFKLSFMEPYVASLNKSDGDFMDYDGTGGAAATDKLLPKLEARYDLSIGYDNRLAFMGGFNSIAVADAGGVEKGTIKSYVFGMMGTHGFKAMYVNWDAFYAVNAGNYGLGSGWVVGSPQAYAAIDPVTFDTEDAFSAGALVALGFYLNDSLSLELGTGYRVDDNENMGFEDPDTTMSFYGQLPIILGKGFFVVPEVGAYVGGDDGSGNDAPTVTYAGAKWQMNF